MSCRIGREDRDQDAGRCEGSGIVEMLGGGLARGGVHQHTHSQAGPSFAGILVQGAYTNEIGKGTGRTNKRSRKERGVTEMLKIANWLQKVRKLQNRQKKKMKQGMTRTRRRSWIRSV